MHQILARIAYVFALIGGLTIAAVSCLTVASIVGRTFFSTPIQGDIEITQFGVAVCISLCLPWCQLHGGNIIVDFFTTRVSARTQQLLDGAGALLIAAMMALLAWRTAAGAISVKEAGETSMILDWPMWIVYAFLGPGLFLTMLIALYQAFLKLCGCESNENSPQEY